MELIDERNSKRINNSLEKVNYTVSAWSIITSKCKTEQEVGVYTQESAKLSRYWVIYTHRQVGKVSWDKELR